MFSNTVLWKLVKEIYPIFMVAVCIYGLIRFGRGVFKQLFSGEEGEIADALSDILVGFFFAHSLLAIIGLIWLIMAQIGDSLDSLVKMLYQTTEAGQESTEIFKHLGE